MVPVYVTGNRGKYESVKKYFQDYNLDVEFYKYDFEEPDINDIEKVSKAKALEAYKILKRPLFVADSGFYIEDYPGSPGYPGAFVKRSGVASDIDNLLKVMENVENRNCKFLDCLTYYDGDKFCIFYGESKGVLAKEKRGVENIRAKSNLWFLFIPQNHDKTLAEMTDEERDNRHDNHTSATINFINWYKTTIKKDQKVKKRGTN